MIPRTGPIQSLRAISTRDAIKIDFNKVPTRMMEIVPRKLLKSSIVGVLGGGGKEGGDEDTPDSTEAVDGGRRRQRRQP